MCERESQYSLAKNRPFESVFMLPKIKHTIPEVDPRFIAVRYLFLLHTKPALEFFYKQVEAPHTL